MNSGKIICIVGPCLKMGGIERASSNVANGLSRLGYKVIYIAVFRQDTFFKLDDAIIFDEPPKGRNETHLSFLYTIRRIRERIKYYKPDTVLVYNKFYAALVAFALWSTEFQYFLSERSSPYFKWSLKIRMLNKIAFYLNPPTGLIAQTSVAAKYQKRYYGRNIAVEVIPNSLEPVEYAECQLDARFILAVGRLNDYLKGFDRLIAAMKLVNPDWNLRIVGADKSTSTLDNLIKELGLENRIQLEPKSANLSTYYLESSIFVIPSRSEGFPNALIEAMAAGLPPVAYNFIGGPEEIIVPGKNGFLVEEGDIKGLAEAINKLTTNRELRISIGNAAKQARFVYSNELITKRIAQFIGV